MKSSKDSRNKALVHRVGVVAQLATHLTRTQPGLRGFTRANLFRMRKFYEAYRHNAKVAALLRQLPWTQNLFLIELGRGFCFVGSQYPLQVGGRDFALDLLFFHRGLNCLVAIELKVGRFEPEYLGKLDFHLEALDRNIRKLHENPALGVLLCASKDDEVVEYALNRSLSLKLLVMEALGNEAAARIDWTSPRLLCIAADFTKYDIHAVQHSSLRKILAVHRKAKASTGRF